MTTYIKWTPATHIAISYREEHPAAAVLALTDRYTGDGFGVEGTRPELRQFARDVLAAVEATEAA